MSITPKSQSSHTDNNGSTLDQADTLEALAQKVDQAVAEVQSLPTEQRVKAMALKSAIEEFHKIGLTLIVKRLKSDPRGKELLFDLVDEPAVYALLAMHSLIRADLRTQASRVLEMVRPYMKSHGGDCILEDVRDKIVYVRLIGNCQGCSMSTVTLRNTVEESLKQHLPEILGVEVVDDLPPAQPALVSIGSVIGGHSSPSANIESDHGWVAGPLVSDIDAARPFEFSADKDQILIVPTDHGLKAYRNSCAHQGLPLDGGLLDRAGDTLTCPWHGFQFCASTGECMSAPQCQLEAFPLRVIDGRVWVRPQS